MNKRQTFQVALSLLTILLFSTESFSQLKFDATVRPRVEYRDGIVQISTPEEIPAFFVSQQSRLGATLKKDNLTAKFTLQDARVWGGDNNLTLYEAWAKYNFSKKIGMKVGRQVLQYDQGRLISSRARRQLGFNYDALVFKYYSDSLLVDLGLSINNSQANLTGNLYEYADTEFKTFNFLYAKKQFDNGLDIAGTVIVSGFQKENTDTILYKQTIGTKIDYKKNGFSTEIEAYYQTGKHKDERSVNAYMVTANVGYKVLPSVKLTLATEILSGHDAQNTDADYQGTLHVFDILQGARFRNYGYMNYFRNIERDTKGGGLIDYYAKLDWKINDKFKSVLFYHYFDLQKEILDANSSVLNRHLGSEVDLVLQYKPKKNVAFNLGYSLGNYTESLEFIQGVPSGESELGHYLWLMLTMNLNGVTVGN